MIGDSPGPVSRLFSRLQDAADPGTERPRRACLLGRSPLQDLTAGRRNSAVVGRCSAAVNDTPGISTLMQKAEKLSLSSARPPAKNPLAKASRACNAVCSPSPQPVAHNPKRKLYESPAGDLACASSSGSERRKSRSAPRKRHCGIGGTTSSLSMPLLPSCTSSPLPGLRSCISAPEPMLASATDDPAVVTPQPAERSHFGPGLLEYAQVQDLSRLQTPASVSPLSAAACALRFQAETLLQISQAEGSQDDTMSSATPGLPGAAQPALMAAAPLLPVPLAPIASLLPQVENAAIGLPSIEPATLAAVLSQQHAFPNLDRVLVVDCRYAYEHGGGCVAGALNIQNPAEMEAMTLEAGGMDWGRTAVVLYCEFSSERGPRMFRHVRNLDRCRHLVVYPALAVPHMYVMSGGYKAFQESFPDLCTPRASYVRMSDRRFDAQLKEQHSRSKAAWCSKDAREKTALPRLTPT